MAKQERILKMVSAALSRSETTPDVDMCAWLTDGWDIIQWRVQAHLDAGRIAQARAWSDASHFFAERYAGQFVAY